MISTPLNSSHWNHALATYPNRDLATFFLQGISQGFRIGFSYGSIHLKPSSLILRQLAPILVLLKTVCKQKSISIKLQDRSHHHHYPAVRSEDSESSQRISSRTSGGSLLISLARRVGVSIVVSQNNCAH